MYLDDLDNLLRGGASTLSAALRERQRGYVLELQREDGGWAGRAGASDPYYTDFAIRILHLTSEPSVEERHAFTRAVHYLSSCPAPNDVVQCFSIVNISRMLAVPSKSGSESESLSGSESIHFDIEPDSDPDSNRVFSPISPLLSRWLLPSGGFSRPGSPHASAYATFLAALCCEMLERPFPEPDRAVAAISALKRPDGGYADLASAPTGQTSATAAAVAFLTMRGALTAPDPTAIDFLRAMQGRESGFHAGAGAPECDLLSTFTALVTLFAMDAMRRIDLKGAVSFISSLAVESGGFRATPLDPAPDLEYTYYGLAALALVRVYIALMKSFA